MVMVDKGKPGMRRLVREKEPVCKSLSYESKAQIARFQDIYSIDERVRELVLRINALPDICTSTSCGGHAEPDDDKGQAGDGEFNVGFFLKPTIKGIRSLGIIDQAASNIDDENIIIRVWNDTNNPNFLVFILTGSNGVDPAILADEIYTLGKVWIDGDWTTRKFF
ncbi:MAG TPA: hypothetical protein PLV96_11050 [Methanoregulaceae archaeon]|nr:hypothetical protein [Methanoregulaceae archaeon]